MPDLEDVAAMALPVLSRRVVMNFQAQAEGARATSLIGPLAMRYGQVQRPSSLKAGPRPVCSP